MPDKTPEQLLREKLWDDSTKVVRITGSRHTCSFEGAAPSLITYCNECASPFTAFALCAECGAPQFKDQPDEALTREHVQKLKDWLANPVTPDPQLHYFCPEWIARAYAERNGLEWKPDERGSMMIEGVLVHTRTNVPVAAS